MIRTVRARLTRWQVANHDDDWAKAMSGIMSAINDSVCRVTGETPHDIMHSAAADYRAFMKISSTKKKKLVRPKKLNVKIGDTVRISVLSVTFEKGSDRQAWSRQVFRVVKIKPPTNKQPRPMIHIEDLDGTLLKGAFYPDELQKVVYDPSGLYPLTVLDRRTNRDTGVREAKIRWIGHTGARTTQWIEASRVQTLQQGKSALHIK